MITVMGSINLDLIAKARRLPAPGETVTGSEFLTAAGGKGANQALAARRAGSLVRMVGAVGDDDFAAQATKALREAGVDMAGVKVRSEPTGIGLILVGADGDNMITVVPGANGTLSPHDAESVVEGMKEDDILMLQLETPLETVAAALSAAKQKGITTVLNVAPFTPAAVPLARTAKVVIANRVECYGLIDKRVDGDSDLDEALTQLHADTGTSFIVTLGGDGVVAIDHGIVTRAMGLAIEPIDTVGAGDTFCGYFAAGMDQGLGFKQSLVRAAVAGSLACLAPGAQSAIPSVDDVNRRLNTPHVS